jgi:hypothetical protein
MTDQGLGKERLCARVLDPGRNAGAWEADGRAFVFARAFRDSASHQCLLSMLAHCESMQSRAQVGVSNARILP